MSTFHISIESTSIVHVVCEKCLHFVNTYDLILQYYQESRGSLMSNVHVSDSVVCGVCVCVLCARARTLYLNNHTS